MNSPLSRPTTTADLIRDLGLRESDVPPGARGAAARAAWAVMSPEQRATVNQAKLESAATTVTSSALAVARADLAAAQAQMARAQNASARRTDATRGNRRG
jgi:hypothetical protein